MAEQHVSNATSRRISELIELGRDREAAELGGALAVQSPTNDIPTRGEPMDVLSQLDEVGALLGGVVGGIDATQLDNPTPCAKFTVRGILEHMVGGATMFAAAFRGAEPEQPDTSDLLAAFGPALTGLAESIHAPGALERTVHAPFGDLPGAAFAQFVVLDGLVHGWDLATATGQPYQPSDALVADVESFARGALANMRDGETFCDPVDAPAGASPIERLAAFTGRQL